MAQSATDTERLIGELCHRIRSAGMRLTSARRAILRILLASDHPLSHRELAAELQALGIDPATAYRNLISLSRLGLLKRSELGDHVWRFELRDLRDIDQHDHVDEHLHLVCTECGRVICLQTLNTELLEVLGHVDPEVGIVREVILKGCCNDCLPDIPA